MLFFYRVKHSTTDFQKNIRPSIFLFIMSGITDSPLSLALKEMEATKMRFFYNRNDLTRNLRTKYDLCEEDYFELQEALDHQLSRKRPCTFHQPDAKISAEEIRSTWVKTPAFCIVDGSSSGEDDNDSDKDVPSDSNADKEGTPECKKRKLPLPNDVEESQADVI